MRTSDCSQPSAPLQLPQRLLAALQEEVDEDEEAEEEEAEEAEEEVCMRSMRVGWACGKRVRDLLYACAPHIVLYLVWCTRAGRGGRGRRARAG